MKRTLGAKVVTQKNRLKRKSSRIGRDIIKVSMLIGVSTVLALFMVYGYNFAMCSDYFEVKKIIVTGCNTISQEKVINLAGIASNTNILAVNLEKIERKIQTNPWIKGVSVGRELPDRLVISVVERKPFAIVARNDALYIADRGGVLFTDFNSYVKQDFPVMTGFCLEGTINRPLLEQAFELIDDIHSMRTKSFIQTIAEIHGDERYGLSLVTDANMLFEIGFSNYRLKLERLQRVLADLERKNLIEGFVKIDIADDDKVFVQNLGDIAIKSPKRGCSI